MYRKQQLACRRLMVAGEFPWQEIMQFKAEFHSEDNLQSFTDTLRYPEGFTDLNLMESATLFGEGVDYGEYGEVNFRVPANPRLDPIDPSKEKTIIMDPQAFFPEATKRTNREWITPAGGSPPYYGSVLNVDGTLTIYHQGQAVKTVGTKENPVIEFRDLILSNDSLIADTGDEEISVGGGGYAGSFIWQMTETIEFGEVYGEYPNREVDAVVTRDVTGGDSNYTEWVGKEIICPAHTFDSAPSTVVVYVLRRSGELETAVYPEDGLYYQKGYRLSGGSGGPVLNTAPVPRVELSGIQGILDFSVRSTSLGSGKPGFDFVLVLAVEGGYRVEARSMHKAWTQEYGEVEYLSRGVTPPPKTVELPPSSYYYTQDPRFINYTYVHTGSDWALTRNICANYSDTIEVLEKSEMFSGDAIQAANGIVLLASGELRLHTWAVTARLVFNTGWENSEHVDFFSVKLSDNVICMFAVSDECLFLKTNGQYWLAQHSSTDCLLDYILQKVPVDKSNWPITDTPRPWMWNSFINYEYGPPIGYPSWYPASFYEEVGTLTRLGNSKPPILVSNTF